MQYAVTTTVLIPVPPLSSTANPLQTEEDDLELVPKIVAACITRNNNLHASQAMSEVRIKNVTSAFSAFFDQVSQCGTMSIIIRA